MASLKQLDTTVPAEPVARVMALTLLSGTRGR